MQNLLMITIKINFLISHENILKLCLETVTWPQNQKIFQLFLYSSIKHCFCSLFSLKSLSLPPTTHSSYHQLANPREKLENCPTYHFLTHTILH